jgi:hypothetical protein
MRRRHRRSRIKLMLAASWWRRQADVSGKLMATSRLQRLLINTLPRPEDYFFFLKYLFCLDEFILLPMKQIYATLYVTFVFLFICCLACMHIFLAVDGFEVFI